MTTPENVASSELVPVAPGLPAGLTLADVEQLRATAAASRSASTRRAYDSTWRTFTTWCEEQGATALPAHPAVIGKWLHTRKSVSAMDLGLAAIRAAHQDAGVPDPTRDETLALVRDGLRRTLGDAATRRAHALTLPQLRRILAGIDTTTLAGKRDRAALLMAYATGLRRSELVGLERGDVTWTGDAFVVKLRWSKGDQHGKGRILPAVEHGAHPETDPVHALHEWLEAAGDGGPTTPLFLEVDRHDKIRHRDRHLTGRTFALILQRRAAAVGLGTLNLSGHSTRRGHAVTAHEHGVGIDDVQHGLGHTAASTTDKYLDESKARQKSYTRRMGL